MLKLDGCVVAKAKSISTAAGDTITYDKLIYATGARPVYLSEFNVPGVFACVCAAGLCVCVCVYVCVCVLSCLFVPEFADRVPCIVSYVVVPLPCNN